MPADNVQLQAGADKMAPEEVGERLRHKHIRTLELLAKVIDENAALKKRSELEEDLQRLVEELQAENEALRSENAEAARRLEEIAAARRESDEKLRDMSIQLKNLDIQYGKQLQAAEAKAADDERAIEELRREIAGLQGELKKMAERFGEAGAVAGRAAALQAELERAQREGAALRAQLLGAERQSAELQAAQKAAQAEAAAAAEARARTEAERQQMEASVARTRKDLEAARASLASHKKECGVHRGELEAARAEALRGAGEAREAAERIAALQAEVARLQEENEELRKRIAALEKALSQAQLEKSQAREAPPDPSPGNGNFSEFVQLKREIARLQARLADVASTGGAAHAGLSMSVSVNIGSGPPLQKLPVVPPTALPVGRSASLSRPRITQPVHVLF
eukprot:tig00020538_g10310.t1